MNPLEIRKPEAKIDSIFLERWSPRAFSDKKVEDSHLKSVFEAARWAPSSFNEQPWRFLYANTEENLRVYRSLLGEFNQVWANRAPVLIFVLSKKRFSMNNQENSVYQFDAGASWMALAIQARKLGLYTHGMAGIKHEEVYSVLNVPKEDYTVLCAVALGYQGEVSELPKELQEKEQPSPRKVLSEIAWEGLFQA